MEDLCPLVNTCFFTSTVVMEPIREPITGETSPPEKQHVSFSLEINDKIFCPTGASAPPAGQNIPATLLNTTDITSNTNMSVSMSETLWSERPLTLHHSPADPPPSLGLTTRPRAAASRPAAAAALLASLSLSFSGLRRSTEDKLF